MAYVYCAGPLFNPAEKAEMESIATVLEKSGNTTFLPHRDGLEFAKLHSQLLKQGVPAPKAAAVLVRAIFVLDVHLILDVVNVVVANLNGRVPDEGTIVEATLAWHKGLPLVFYKSDVRSLLYGADNPLVLGLTNFQVVASIQEIPDAVEHQLKQSRLVKDVCRLGLTVEQLRQQHTDESALAAALLQALKS